MTESFLSKQYDLQITTPKLFIPKADEKPPPLQETSRLPAGTWLLMPLPTTQLKSFRNQTSNCKSLCSTNSSRQAVSAAGGSPFSWDLWVQMQNKDKILLWYHLSSWRLFISVEGCYMTVPLCLLQWFHSTWASGHSFTCSAKKARIFGGKTRR